MSRSLNQVQLIGNVGADPEINTTASGRKVARVSLATNFSWRGANDEIQERTQWHTLTAWGPVADVIEKHVHVGDKLYVSGRLEYSTSGEGDAKKYWTEIVVKELIFLNGKQAERQGPPLPDDDDLPF